MPRFKDRYEDVEPLKVTLPAPVSRAFRHALTDPARNRLRYGAASLIITELVREWLRRNGHPEELHGVDDA